MPCDQRLVFDSSALINTKSAIRVGEQWDFFDALLQRVRSGLVVVPRQVMKEISESRWPDMPGAWAATAYHQSPYANDADYEWVQEVMARTPDIIEVDAEVNKADPWGLALALQLASDGMEVVVVTNDNRDRPTKISLASACRSFGIESIDLEGALQWLDNHPA